ncbi:ABC transporter substrate-binding protein [Thermodesulfobacteriota bacterium]
MSRMGFQAAAIAAALLFLGGFFLHETHAFNEAPELADQVKAGKLPAVDKRLPASPAVVKPIDKPGVYGGKWRRACTNLKDLSGATRRILYDPLVRWSPDYKLLPNLAKKWEVTEKARVFTFHLVEGVRWSDGEPFTADDIIFYFEDVLGNKEISPSPPKWLAPTGKLPKVTKSGDYTVRFEFEKPYSLFIQRLACPEGMHLVTKPKHFLKRYHKKYAKPEELEALVKKHKASSWIKLFQDVSNWKRAMYEIEGIPTTCAWIAEAPASSRQFILKRNPFYWKVDDKGNQLPYIDRVVTKFHAESQTILLSAIKGDIDFQGRRLGGMQNSVLLLANKATGIYKLIPKTSTASVGLLLAPNINHKDPAMRKILADKRFRMALSHAINREEINKILYRGKGKPRQAAPLEGSPFYSKDYEEAYLEFNPAKAEALLDEMGLKKGADGMRMRPDGKPVQLTLDVIVNNQTYVDGAEILAFLFKNIGVETEVKSEAPEFFFERVRSAAHDIALWSGDGGLECLLEPRWYFPYSTESLQAPLYAQWFQTSGKQGEEPPADIKKLMDTFVKITESGSDEEQKKMFAEIIQANKENLWVIGLVHQPPDYYVAAKNMHNTPKRDFQSWKYPNPGPVHPEQFFMTKKK